MQTNGIQEVLVIEHGFYGSLFLPPIGGAKELPFILLLGGAGGGISRERAHIFASLGFSVLALAYFKAPGLPSLLTRVPLEYVEKAISWIRRSPLVHTQKIVMIGVSRGAELALLSASYLPLEIQGIVGYAAPSAVYPGFESLLDPAWVYKGQSVSPAAPLKIAMNSSEGKDQNNPLCFLSFFLEGMTDQASFQKALIPVENIRCPILLFSGGDDQIWPSCTFARQIQSRLKQARSISRCIHRSYPHAGHSIAPGSFQIVDFHIPLNRWVYFGGNADKNQKAKQNALEFVIKFLKEMI